MSETNQERSARLKLLALKVPAWRSVWREKTCAILIDDGTAFVGAADGGETEQGDEDTTETLLDACGDVDAFEAALRVLAKEPAPLDEEDRVCLSSCIKAIQITPGFQRFCMLLRQHFPDVNEALNRGDL